MQNNIIKLASIELNKSNDIIKTAGILRLLKNKLFNLFDSDKSQKVSRMINYTGSSKPLLNQTYKLIKDIESSIDDLDVDTYNTNIDLLKQKVDELNNELQKLNKSLDEDVKVSEAERVKQESGLPSGSEGSSSEGDSTYLRRRERPRELKLPEGAKIYEGKTKLSDLDVKKEDIIGGKNVGKFITSWFHIVARDFTQEQKSKLSEQQNLLTLSDLNTLFYNKIPDMKIIKVKTRELVTSNRAPLYGTTGDPKPGYCEITVESELTQLEGKLNNWKLKVIFTLVDQRKKINDELKYTIYLQRVVIANNEDTKKNI